VLLLIIGISARQDKAGDEVCGSGGVMQDSFLRILFIYIFWYYIYRPQS
jgi:hypothetical protein